MKTGITPSLLLSALLTLPGVVGTASGQNYTIDSYTLSGGGGTSAGENYSLSASIGQVGAGSMSGDNYTLEGGFWSATSVAPPEVIAIFDNLEGSSNGEETATSEHWLASKLCLGAESYRLHSVTIPLNGSLDPQVSTVRLEIFSDDPLTGKPAASVAVMNLSGRTNPITTPAGNSSISVTWTPANPLILLPDTCYWVVLSLEEGEGVDATASTTPPVGAAAAFGRTSSFSAGTTWFASDNTSNRKMLILATAVNATPSDFRISALEMVGSELRFSFPTSLGRSYAVEGRAELTTGEWETIPGTTNAGTGGPLQMILGNPLPQSGQFYRIKQLP